jgi:hypothetical protein
VGGDEPPIRALDALPLELPRFIAGVGFEPTADELACSHHGIR